jgi:endonuclease-3
MGEAGLVVDTHVHRVALRLGWADYYQRGPPTLPLDVRRRQKQRRSTPEACRKSLQRFVPSAEWADFTTVLIGFGQQTCGAQRPKCSECPVRGRCPSANLPGQSAAAGQVVAAAGRSLGPRS